MRLDITKPIYRGDVDQCFRLLDAAANVDHHIGSAREVPGVGFTAEQRDGRGDSRRPVNAEGRKVFH